jgi:ketose-bisphosphate aldolase
VRRASHGDRIDVGGCTHSLVCDHADPVLFRIDAGDLRLAVEVRACIALGYTSVMIDGSHLPFEDNVAVTRAAVEHAHAAGVWVEGELGGLCGNEDSSSDAVAGDLTDPRQAQEFVARTGVDALAPAVGTVHGFTAKPVHVDLDRLRAIARTVDVPLVLHGASGLSDDELRAVVACGVAKVDVNAELRRGYLSALDAARAAEG